MLTAKLCTQMINIFVIKAALLQGIMFGHIGCVHHINDLRTMCHVLNA